MADPFPVASTPGVYATYPGRVVPGAIPDRVAPDLEATYYRLAPDADVFYGTFLPVAFNRPGSARWMQEGTNFRWSLPAIVRDGLLGALDLANATHTGEVTPRLAQTFAFGMPMAGLGLAERGALGAAGARPVIPSLSLDEASRFGRAREIQFRPRLNLYHWTDAPDFPAFAYGDGRSKSLGLRQYGFWAAEDPRYLEDVARLVGRPDGTGSRVIPLVPRFSKLGEIDLEPGLTHQDIALNIPMLWGEGYDALRFKNYNTLADGTPTPTWLFRHPNQLRSRFARFDPAKSDSDDLLAGSAVPAPLAAPASAPEQRTPGFRGPPSPAESLAYWRFMHQPKVY